MEAATLYAPVLEKVKELEPILRQYSSEAEKIRRLPEPVLEAMKSAGLFGIWKPKALGGLEVDPVTGMQVFEQLAKYDSAAGWNLQLTAGIDIILQWFSDEGMEEVFASDEEVIVAGTWHPPGQANRVKGGYEISGHWNISSGCQYANWFFLNAILLENGEMQLYEDGSPKVNFFIFPADKGQVIDCWDMMGMRGTGSHDIVVEKVFVPDHRTVPMAPIEIPNSRAFSQPLYNNSVWYAIAALAAPALGIAQAALDEASELIKNKIPNFTQAALQQGTVTQMQLGKAATILGAGRAYFYEAVKETWATAQKGHRINMEQKMKMQLATINAAQSAAKCVNLIYEIAGLTGPRKSSRFEKHFRDVNTITQHAFLSTSRYQAVGQLMLGLEPDWGFFYF